METLLRIWRTKEIRQSVLFVLFAVTLFRIAAHIPVPGINTDGLSALLSGNQFLGLLNVFSGGTLMSFSIVALGVSPYITSSIVFQLLGMIFPSMEEMQKEEQGRQKLNRWTRVATVPLALLQGFALLKLISQQGTSFGVNIQLTGFEWVVALVSMVAGTIFLMWLGELISERKIGNGVSLMIFAGIIAGLPSFIGQSVATYNSSQLMNVLVFLALAVITLIGVIVITEGQRNVPVQYARGARIGSTKVQSHLPLRVNMVGMIPIIFSLSIVVLPPLIAQFFVDARTQVIRDAATFIIQLFANQTFYGIFYFVLVVAFTYFYASIVFKPTDIAENLQKQGGFVPGIRPGAPTAKYFEWVSNRLLLTGATFLGVIAVLPILVQGITNNANFVIGGSSVIIVVSVVIDIIKQMESQLTMRSYDV
ncbi:TPA: preprotein translocase subunit SecY [Candidatus Uhrbacteria bacterium]|nr:preprotein translocase subunit SecY [Candidatus Uhrbacteria bacterium]